MRKTILIFFLFSSALNLYSQQDSLLKKFKFRNVNYRAISFSVYGSGQYNNTDYAAGNSKGHASGGNLGASYYTGKSTDKILLNVSGGFYVSGNADKTKNTSGTNKNSSYYLYPMLSALNKWFSKKFFTELGVDASLTISNSKNSVTVFPGTTKSNQHNYSLAVTAGVGKGRLENITDMQNALWLNQSLEKEGRLSRSLSAEELNDLGRAITVADNTRVLDSRKRTRFVLETVDNYFQQKSLIDKTDITYFSNLNDILFFAFNNPRLSGTEKYIRVTPAISRYNVELSQSSPSSGNNNTSIAKSVRVAAGISRYVPANLHHQNNYGISIQASYLDNDASQKYFVSGVLVNEIKMDPVLRQAGVNLFFQHAIYPTTRTIIDFNLQSEGGYEKINGESSAYGNVDISGSLNYFISYRTRLTAAIGVMYQSNINRLYNYYLELLPDNLQLYANAGIQVSL